MSGDLFQFRVTLVGVVEEARSADWLNPELTKAATMRMTEKVFFTSTLGDSQVKTVFLSGKICFPD